MDTLNFELGERRRISLKVWINGADSFALSAPVWELKKQVKESSGTCEATQDGAAWVLVAEVQPKQKGQYELQFTFNVGTEIIKKSARINVA